MTVGRVATFANASHLFDLTASARAQLLKAQAAQASGKASVTYSGLSGNVSALLAYEGESADLEARSATATQAAARLEQTYTVVGNVADLASDIRTTLASWQSASNESSDIATRAQGWMEELQSLLNTSTSGRYLFSGDALDCAPVDITALGSAAASSPDYAYYQGAASGDTLMLGAGAAVTTSLEADNPAFETLFRSLSLMAQASDPSTVLSQAFDLAGTAVTALGSLQETISAQTQALDRYVASADARTDALDTFASALRDADLAEATLLVTQYQTQLEAAYSSLADVLKLSLLDYL